MPESLEMVPYTYSFCRRCDRRVELGRIAFGEKIKCPGCGFEFAILQRPHSLDGTGEGRGGQGGQPQKVKREKQPVRKVKKNDADGKIDHFIFSDTIIGAVPSPGVFLSETFTFPLHPRTLWQTLTLAGGAAVLVAAVQIATWCIGMDGEEVDPGTRVLLWNGILLSIVLGTMVAPSLLYAASAFGMTVLRDTSCGVKSIESWPRLLAIEGLGEIVYVSLGLILAWLPGLFVAPLWRWLGVPMPWGMVIVAALLFPIFLMSMLEANSLWHWMSPPVWKSLLRAWPAWAAFHLTTIAAFFAALGLWIAAFRLVGGATGVIIAGLILASFWMFYFRLLGRLAWFSLGKAKKPGK